jgi:hypothetical protein
MTGLVADLDGRQTVVSGNARRTGGPGGSHRAASWPANCWNGGRAESSRVYKRNSIHDTKGLVYLIGAGPGDPELITAKGLRCIRTADVLIYDYLAAKAFLATSARRASVFMSEKKGVTTPFPRTASMPLS